VRAVLADLADAPSWPRRGPAAELDSIRGRSPPAARAGLLLGTEQVVLAPGAQAQAAQSWPGCRSRSTTAEASRTWHHPAVAIPLLEYLDRAGITQRLPMTAPPCG